MRLQAWLQRCRESRQLVLVIVAIALLLDNMLLTTVGTYTHRYLRTKYFLLLPRNRKLRAATTSTNA